MTRTSTVDEAPFASRKGFFAALIGTAVVLGLLVVVDVLPRLEPPPPEIEGEPFLPADLGDVAAIEVVRGRKNFRLDQTSDGWMMLDGSGRAPVPSETAEDFLKELRGLVELVDIGPGGEVSLAEFGLADPKERIVLKPAAGPEVRILFGDRNPPLTGIYTLILPENHVVLVGAVLLLEADKLAALASVKAP